MNAFHKILLWAIVVFAMLFIGIWLFNHVYAWFGVAFIAVAIYAVVRYAIHIINNLNK